MEKLSHIVGYLCVNYPNKYQLSNARVTKLVYLADWFSALTRGRQMSDIKWIFNHYGPYVEDILKKASEENERFEVISTATLYGNRKQTINYIGDEKDIQLEEEEREILDMITQKTHTLYFNDFIDYVYSSYPVQSSERYSRLDLEKLAKEYNEQNNLSDQS